ncbi:adhesion G protein-coupled receptor F5 isoform X2 [Hemibagrus wyckioides]|uniref:adhesion G protein-coupled receptor F5 isoform X2 n=1 Tax=Hemibagrus wyckioides TaxID=337641 RepID=UPI00266B50C4|nr:adhesion G protein-coupled receptor F5 isoform X2 [Hemibagrus wyckioides]
MCKRMSSVNSRLPHTWYFVFLICRQAEPSKLNSQVNCTYITRKISKYDLLGFVVILLIKMQLVNSQVLPEISDIVEFSYPEEQVPLLRKTREVNTGKVEYIVIVEVNASEVILFDQVKASADSITPLQIDNITNISGLDIRAVCQPNNTQYQCTCVDQYVWSYNNCITYNNCDNLNDGTCTCISAIPSDGQVCLPKTGYTTTPATTANTTIPVTTAITTTPATTANTTIPVTTAITTTPATTANTTTPATTAITTTPATTANTTIPVTTAITTTPATTAITTTPATTANTTIPVTTANTTIPVTTAITTTPATTANTTTPATTANTTIPVTTAITTTPATTANTTPATTANTTTPATTANTTIPVTTAITTTPATTAITTTPATTANTTIPVTTANTTTPVTTANTTIPVTTAITTTPVTTANTTIPVTTANTTTPVTTAITTTPATTANTTIPVTTANTTTPVTTAITTTPVTTANTTIPVTTANTTIPVTTAITTTPATTANTTTPVTTANTTTPATTANTTIPVTTAITTTPVTTANTTTPVTTANTTTPVTTANTTIPVTTAITTTPATTAITTTPATTANTTTPVTTANTTIPVTTAITTPGTKANTTIPATKANTTTPGTKANTTTPGTKANTTTPGTKANTTTPATKANTTTPPTTTTTTTTTAAITTPAQNNKVLRLSLKLNQSFDFELLSKSSTTYKSYETKIKNSIEKSYKNVPGYQLNSATVTGFRPGSVFADFSINTTSTNIDLASASQQLATNLRNNGFSVSDDLLRQNENNGIKWTLNEIQLQQSEQYVINNTELTVKNAGPSNSGQYSCIATVNSLPYTIWQMITIQPYPNIQVTSDKTLECQDTTISLQCCVQGVYQVKWTDPKICNSLSKGGCISCDYKINKEECQATEQTKTVSCQLTQPISESSYNSKTIKINVTNQNFDCSDNVFGAGILGATQTSNCPGDMVGYQVAQCSSSKQWNITEDKCVLRAIQNLKDEAETLQVAGIPQFMASLSSNATSQTQNLIDSAATITTIVDILTIVSDLSQTTFVSQTIMTDFLKTAEVIGTDGSSHTWESLNKNDTTSNASNILLNATESIARRLLDDNFLITTNFTYLKKESITAPFSEDFGKNLTTHINIPVTSAKMFLTVIISSAFNNILPVRTLTNNDSNQTGTKINGDVVLTETTSKINNISLSFKIMNTTLGNPQCVFWNFSLLNGVGGWDSTGCQLKLLGNESEKYTCECNHTTSFSILMSPFTLDKNKAIILDYITYIGVGISMGSLVLCLIIEIIIWKLVTRNDTSYMRHVSIVNIAVSLLIADICFIIGAAVVKQEGPCSTATFFMHFFYLALFFWMLLSALLLLYRTLMVFSRMTRGAMMGIGFTVGYGAPLIIAVITVASTAGNKGYIQQDYNCWLNWSKTKALLAFVIPALTIVAINFLVLIVVLFKMMRRGVNASTQPDEKHSLVVIAKCVAILTPLFGLTWGFGIGTLVSSNFGIHVVFAFLNSLQGFFILLFGLLLDSKVREALAGKFSLRNLSSGHTRSTSAGPTSSSGFPFMQRLRQRYVYNVQQNSGNTASASNSSYAPINT